MLNFTCEKAMCVSGSSIPKLPLLPGRLAYLL